MKQTAGWLPWTVAGLAVLWVATAVAPRSAPGFPTREFGRLPVLLNGRVQPLDSVARNALLQLRNKQTVLLHDRRSLPAVEWLMDTLMQPARADTLKAFRIDHPELLSLLKLPEDEKHFAFNQLEPMLGEVEKQAHRISEKDNAQRTVFEKQTMKLYSALALYQRLKNSLQPESSTNFSAELADYERILPAGVAAVEARQEGKDFNAQDLNQVLTYVRRYSELADRAYPLIIPPRDPQQSRDAWENIGASLVSAVHTGSVHPAVKAFAALSTAYGQGDAAGFNRALADYRAWLGAQLAPEVRKAHREFLFNQVQPFYKATVLYVLAFLIICVSWVRVSELLRRTAWHLVAVALVIHTLGLLFRMILEGRPPVTNLYSSAVFIGWGAAILGLVLERFTRGGLGLATASGVGFITQIIAHNLALGGDTMEMMRAVLDTNFWLATHVVTITIGYSSNFVAGFLGILFILRGVLTRSLSPDMAGTLARMIYGIVCFATFFSFVGTVLGGIWADQSWGRFWGWDPKENGALIIVLWNAIILHARWGGLARERGLAALAVFGNVVTSYSWFGVNMLGVGLHSYGFMDAAFKWLILFVVSQLAIIGLGLLPPHRWRSAVRGATAQAGAPPAVNGRKKRAAPAAT
jgi:ABC-type transport system involved in cytochrome c biogenesis permease subunit